jgi:hypothetical protein
LEGWAVSATKGREERASEGFGSFWLQSVAILAIGIERLLMRNDDWFEGGRNRSVFGK